MSDNDKLQRFIFEGTDVRGGIVHLNNSLQTILNQQDYQPPIRLLLGEALAAVSLLSLVIKFDGSITLQFQGKDALKLLLVECSSTLKLRGLVDWRESIAPEELAPLFKAGTLAIMLKPNKKSGNSYQSIVNWEGNSLAAALENYFNQSEQIPTRIWLNSDQTCAAGILLQALPQQFSIPAKWDELALAADQINKDDLLFSKNKMLLKNLYPQEDIRLFSSKSVKFGCQCSRKRSKNAVLLLGEKEVNEELLNKQQISVICQFCHREFIFDKIAAAKIFANIPPSSSQVH